MELTLSAGLSEILVVGAIRRRRIGIGHRHSPRSLWFSLCVSSPSPIDRSETVIREWEREREIVNWSRFGVRERKEMEEREESSVWGRKKTCFFFLQLIHLKKKKDCHYFGFFFFFFFFSFVFWEWKWRVDKPVLLIFWGCKMCVWGSWLANVELNRQKRKSWEMDWTGLLCWMYKLLCNDKY